MQQLVISITPSILNKELECTDFLAESNHSAEWIGNPADWKIKSLNIWNDKRNNPIMTAFLENANWEEPKVKAITGEELFAAIHNYPKLPIVVSEANGLYKKTNPIKYRYHSTSINCQNIIKFHFSNVFGWRENIACQLLEDIGYTFDNETWQMDGEYEKILKSSLAVELGDNERAAVYPITAVQIKKDMIILIYNHDVNIVAS